MSTDIKSNNLIPIEIDNDTIDSITKFITEQGVSGLEKFTQKQLDQWQTCTLNVATTGNSGVGKSTLINTLRSLRARDKDAAAVNVTECTKVATPYIHPENENLTLWDLPGIKICFFSSV
jgi:predicted GTPase